MAQDGHPPLVVNPRQRSVELPAEPPRQDPPPEAFAHLHATAARMDGMVKMLTGLVLVIIPLGLVIAGAVGLHALIRLQQVRIWALVMGIPGLLLTMIGLVLIAIGAWKAVSGRGRG